MLIVALMKLALASISALMLNLVGSGKNTNKAIKRPKNIVEMVDNLLQERRDATELDNSGISSAKIFFRMETD